MSCKVHTSGTSCGNMLNKRALKDSCKLCRLMTCGDSRQIALAMLLSVSQKANRAVNRPRSPARLRGSRRSKASPTVASSPRHGRTTVTPARSLPFPASQTHLPPTCGSRPARSRPQATAAPPSVRSEIKTIRPAFPTSLLIHCPSDGWTESENDVSINTGVSSPPLGLAPEEVKKSVGTAPQE